MNFVRGDVDVVDSRLDETAAVVQLTMARADDVLAVHDPERDEQQFGLVHMTIILIDNGQLQLVKRKHPPQAVGDKGPTRTAPKNHHTLDHDSS